MHRAHSSVEIGSVSVFVCAPRRSASDLISTAFQTALGRFRSRIIGFAKIRFVTGRMRAAVVSGLIVRGLGNFRRVGVAGGGVSVVDFVRSSSVYMCARTYRDVHGTCVCTRILRAQTCIRTCCVVFRRAIPSRRYLNAYLALETSSLLPRLDYTYVAITWIPCVE